MLYMFVIFLAMAAIAFFSMDMRGDRLEYEEYPKAQAAIASMVYQFKALRLCLADRNIAATRIATWTAGQEPYRQNDIFYALDKTGPAGNDLLNPANTCSGYLPQGFQPTPHIRSYVVCVNKADGSTNIPAPVAGEPPYPGARTSSSGGGCNRKGSVDYLLTVYDMPFKLDVHGQKQTLSAAIKKYASKYTGGIVQNSTGTSQVVVNTRKRMPDDSLEDRTYTYNRDASPIFTVVDSTRYVTHPWTGREMFYPLAFHCAAGGDLTGRIIMFEPIMSAVGEPYSDPANLTDDSYYANNCHPAGGISKVNPPNAGCPPIHPDRIKASPGC